MIRFAAKELDLWHKSAGEKKTKLDALLLSNIRVLAMLSGTFGERSITAH